jgi:hypothetical protein
MDDPSSSLCIRPAMEAVADVQPSVALLVLNASIAERDKLCCFPEPAYVATACSDRRVGDRRRSRWLRVSGQVNGAARETASFRPSDQLGRRIPCCL